ECAYAHLRLMHGERPRLDPRRVEQVPDEVLHRLGGPVDDTEPLLLMCLVERDLAQHSRTEDNRVHRVAQVVRDYGHYLVANPARTPGRLPGRALAGEQSLAFSFGSPSLGNVEADGEPTIGGPVQERGADQHRNPSSIRHGELLLPIDGDAVLVQLGDLARVRRRPLRWGERTPIQAAGAK